jgi:hypothetical protein
MSQRQLAFLHTTAPTSAARALATACGAKVLHPGGRRNGIGTAATRPALARSLVAALASPGSLSRRAHLSGFSLAGAALKLLETEGPIHIHAADGSSVTNAAARFLAIATQGSYSLTLLRAPRASQPCRVIREAALIRCLTRAVAEAAVRAGADPDNTIVLAPAISPFPAFDPTILPDPNVALIPDSQFLSEADIVTLYTKMAEGTIVAVSPASAASQIVEHGWNGLRLGRSAGTSATAINNLLAANPDLHRRLRLAARAYAESHAKLERCAAILSARLKRALECRAAQDAPEEGDSQPPRKRRRRRRKPASTGAAGADASSTEPTPESGPESPRSGAQPAS